mmetsp:Transcript_5651/g.9761  ORF Transcript_5651/g.9761 Transcript_5651/m.9761 type:complete len:176 (+) Transcript_5651:92-619(+)|eukprot:CAMPEP_0196665714 /NCGR_PEP_ID=MMETSP1086-20130531/62273_1 /TAXON_ID=77921 /ORGANISM="Cyanoptyche  gloeocystis , Strain SAG4.97" /LENGTH=175 /DNA_ID=CAMNT_0042002611 /DNA_START=82 /DNA_END=609 /DNA_ORIENTATION=-
MAKASAKKCLESNTKILRRHLYAILLANALFLAVRAVWMNHSFSYWHWAGFASLVVCYYVCYKSLASSAEAEYDDEGKLIDGGTDLATVQGLSEYAFDVIYVGIFVQLGAILTDWFWLVWLIIPGFAFFKLWTLVLWPFFFAPRPEEPEEDEKKKRKRERQERRAQQPKMRTVFR